MKRRRTSNDLMDVAKLVDDLRPLAQQRIPGFAWSMRDYAKRKRSLGPDHSGLLKHRDLLVVVASHAPCAFPAQVQLRSALIVLDEELGIWHGTGSRELWAAEAADIIRVMMKHCRDIKMSSGSYLQAGLEPILAHIDVPELAPSSSSAPPPPPSSSRMLEAMDSGASSVRFCGFACRCPSCVEAENVVSSASDPDPGVPAPENDSDSCSADAYANLTSVPAERGKVANILRKPAASSSQDPKDAQRPKVKVNVVNRVSPPEQYIMFDGKHLVGCSAKQCGAYKEVIGELVQLLQGGQAFSKKEAKEWLKAAIQAHR